MVGSSPSKTTGGTSAAVSVYHARGATMGTHWTAQWVAAEDGSPDVVQDLQAAVDLVDTQMSTWKPTSDLCRVNAAPVGEWVEIPKEFAFVIDNALAVGRSTSGAFDVTVGSQVNDWGFGPVARKTGLPTTAPSVGIAALELDTDRAAVRRTMALSIDLSGIAKGYGVDLMAEAMERAGIGNYFLTLDGEVRCHGRKPANGGRWTVGLDAPVAGEKRAWDVLEMEAGSLATSGDYRHFIVVDGRVRAHTIDPATGQPLDNGIASVTVFDPFCWRADAWATALMVLGPQKGIALAQARDIPALFLIRDDDGITERTTGSFDSLCHRDDFNGGWMPDFAPKS